MVRSMCGNQLKIFLRSFSLARESMNCPGISEVLFGVSHAAMMRSFNCG